MRSDLLSLRPLHITEPSLELTTTQLLFNPSSSIQFDYQEGEGLDLSLTNTSSRVIGMSLTEEFGSIIHRSYSHIFKIEGSSEEVSIIDGGTVTRSSTGRADLLPIAYGSVCKQDDMIEVLSNSTQNFSASGPAVGQITLTFPNSNASDITLIVSPIADCGGAPATQSIHYVSDNNDIDVVMFTPSGGSAVDMAFSFVAYANDLPPASDEQ